MATAPLKPELELALKLALKLTWELEQEPEPGLLLESVLKPKL